MASMSKGPEHFDAEVTLTKATEADLPALIELQFDTFAHIEVEEFLTGPNTEHYRTAAMERHRSDMRADPGLVIVKAEIRGESQQPQKTKLVGFCMFHMPNDEAESELERTPTVLRPLDGPVQAPWFEDPSHRRLAESIMTALTKQRLKDVAGRRCACIRYMSVRRGYQRQGIGRKLMQWGCERLDTAGCDAYLEASREGRLLYLHFGFENIGELRVEGDGEHFSEAVYPTMWRKARRK